MSTRIHRQSLPGKHPMDEFKIRHSKLPLNPSSVSSFFSAFFFLLSLRYQAGSFCINWDEHSPLTRLTSPPPLSIHPLQPFPHRSLLCLFCSISMGNDDTLYVFRVSFFFYSQSHVILEGMTALWPHVPLSSTDWIDKSERVIWYGHCSRRRRGLASRLFLSF